MITTVVFDLDDTLYDEIDYCKSGFAAVAEFLANRSEGRSADPATASAFPATASASAETSAETRRISAALWEQFTAGNRTKTFNTALEKLSMDYDDKLIGELIKVYRNHNPKITLPQDSRDVLCELSTKYTLALLTDGFLPAQQLKVWALGIEKYFKLIVYTEQLGREFWKPSPTGFEKIMQTLRAKPENMAYIADNEKKDFIAPNKLGFLTIQLIRPARIPRTVCGGPEAAAQHTIGQISQLSGLLEKL
jgi:putative hydrolase of the HAD superfamily